MTLSVFVCNLNFSIVGRREYIPARSTGGRPLPEQNPKVQNQIRQLFLQQLGFQLHLQITSIYAQADKNKNMGIKLNFVLLCLTNQNKYQIAFFLHHFLNLLKKFCYLENKETVTHSTNHTKTLMYRILHFYGWQFQSVRDSWINVN